MIKKKHKQEQNLMTKSSRPFRDISELLTNELPNIKAEIDNIRKRQIRSGRLYVKVNKSNIILKDSNCKAVKS